MGIPAVARIPAPQDRQPGGRSLWAHARYQQAGSHGAEVVALDRLEAVTVEKVHNVFGGGNTRSVPALRSSADARARLEKIAMADSPTGAGSGLLCRERVSE